MRFTGFWEMLSYWADRTPDAPALCYEGPEGKKASLSFALLREAVEASARAEGSRPGVSVGFLMDTPTPEALIRLFGAVRAGHQAVLLDGNASEDVLREQLQSAQADTLSGDPELCGELEDALCPPRAAGAETAGRVLFFTSGTTERSKAVVLTEKSLMTSAWNGAALLPLAPEDTLLCLLPLNHVFGFVCSLLWGLSCGACVALGRGPRHYGDDCAYFEPTALSLVPLLLGFLLKQNALNPACRLLLIGAGGCPKPLLDAARAGGRRVSFGYGLTETSSGVALSLGEDPYAMTVCPDYTVTTAEDGEVLVRAPGAMMLGYLHRPADTEKVLQNGVLSTGDLGFLDENGLLHITGRKKEMLVLADGTKVFLPEYEAELAAALGTQELAVAERDGAPVLFLEGSEKDRAEVMKKLAPVMAARPRGQQLRQILFTAHPLPRTASGKIKRYEIRED